MIADHTDFDVLCALAATGLLMHEESLQLRDHALACAECRGRMLDLAEVGLWLLAVPPQGKAARMPTGIEERFAARALREGVSLSRRRTTSWKPRRLAFASIALMVVLASLTLNWNTDASPPATLGSRLSGVRAESQTASKQPVDNAPQPPWTNSNSGFRSRHTGKIGSAHGQSASRSTGQGLSLAALNTPARIGDAFPLHAPTRILLGDSLASRGGPSSIPSLVAASYARAKSIPGNHFLYDPTGPALSSGDEVPGVSGRRLFHFDAKVESFRSDWPSTPPPSFGSNARIFSFSMPIAQ